MGVVGAILPLQNGLSALTGVIAPVIAGGNTMVSVASEKYPLTAIEFAEVLGTSDVPPGVVNILTGYNSDLLRTVAGHMDVNAIVITDGDKEKSSVVKKLASSNIKRTHLWEHMNWNVDSVKSPSKVMDLQEIKTVWQPGLV
jgi:acyl-CoA reductase-like NAD-dependent aldehyde dehydrogenase